MIYWSLISWIGIGLFGVGTYSAFRTHSWIRSTNVTEGTVIALAEGSGDGVTYHPRIRYFTPEGNSHEFVSPSGSNPPSFSIGEHVEVALDPVNSKVRLLTFWECYGGAALLILTGTIFVLFGLTFIIGPTVVPKIYLK